MSTDRDMPRVRDLLGPPLAAFVRFVVGILVQLVVGVVIVGLSIHVWGFREGVFVILVLLVTEEVFDP